MQLSCSSYIDTSFHCKTSTTVNNLCLEDVCLLIVATVTREGNIVKFSKQIMFPVNVTANYYNSGKLCTNINIILLYY